MDESTVEFKGTIDPLLGPPLQPGDEGSVGAYRLINTIGAGGMGFVYRGRKVGEERDVAIKVLAPALVSSLKARQRFVREAAMAADLRHDRLAGLLDMGETGGLPFFVMPLLVGETLEQKLNREPILSSNVIVGVARDVLEGLAFASANGIIHRDIKPSNLWLEATENGPASDSVSRVKILDLGLARRLTDDERVTSSGVMLGTPEYMSPEQVRGGDGDARSDLFSLGCVLYRMATGAPPFRGANLMAALRSLAMTEAMPPHELNASISRGLSDFIMTLIAKAPSDRFPSADEARRALDRVDDYRAPVRQASPRTTAPVKPRRHSHRLAYLLFAIALLAGGVAVVRVSNRATVDHPPGVDARPLSAATSAPEMGGPPAVPQPPSKAIAIINDELTNADLLDKSATPSYRKIHFVSLEQDKLYRIDLQSTAFDPQLLLTSAGGVVLARGERGGGGTDVKLVHRVDTSGNYRVAATSNVPEKLGQYTLTVSEAGPIDAFELRTKNYAKLNTTERALLFREVKDYLGLQQPGPDRAAASLALALVVEMEKLAGRNDLLGAETADRCDQLAAALAKSADADVQDTGRWLEGFSRRYRLTGQPINIAGHTLDGVDFDWSAYRGKTVLVDFWAAAAPLCVARAAELKRLNAAYKDKGFEIVGVNADATAEAALHAVREWNLPWPNIREPVDKRQPLHERFGAYFLPEWFLVGPDGKVIVTCGRREDLTLELAKCFGDVEAFEQLLALAPDRAAKARIIAKAARVQGLLKKLAERAANDATFQAELARHYSAQGNEPSANAARAKARAQFQAEQAKKPANSTLADELAQLGFEEKLAREPDNFNSAAKLAQLLLERREKENPTHWTVLKPVEAKSKLGATFSLLPDDSVLVSGMNLPKDRYSVVLSVGADVNLAAVRLEAIADPSLPGNGPGRRPPGTFSQLSWQATATPPAQSDPIKLVFDKAWSAQQSPTSPIKADGHWNIGGNAGRNGEAIWSLSNPVFVSAGATFAFEMQFATTNGGEAFNLGCFRLSVSSDHAELDRKLKSFTAMKLGNAWEKLAAAYHLLGDQNALDRLLARHPTAIAGIGELFNVAHDSEPALAAYGKASDAEPADGSLSARLGWAYGLGRAWEALPHLAKASTANPSDTQLSLGVAALQAWFGQDEELAVTLLRILTYAKFTSNSNTAERAAKVLSMLPSTDKTGLEAALALARSAMALDKGTAWSQLALGMAEYRNGNDAAADEALLVAAKADPKTFYAIARTAAFYRALVLFRQGKLDEARQVAITTAKSMPFPKDEKQPQNGGANYDDLIFWLAFKEANALIHFEPGTAPVTPRPALTGERQEALKKKGADYHASQGAWMKDRGRLDEAVVHFRIAVELGPPNASAIFNLGFALGMKGQLDEAVASFRKSIELDPSFANAHYGLGAALHAKGKVEEAIASLRQAIELDPMFANAHHSLGAALYLKGQVDDAIASLRRAVELDAKLIFAYNALALALRSKGQLNESIAVFRKAIEIGPQQAFIHHNLANTLKANGQSDEAIASYRKAVELEPTNDTVWRAALLAPLGLALLEQKKWREAEPVLRECLTIREKTLPNDWLTYSSRSMLGGALLGLGKHAEAEPLLVQGYEGMKQREKTLPAQAAKRLPESLDRLIDLYTATNKPEEANKWRAERAKYK